MKDFHCRDVGNECDFVAKGKSNEEILRKAADHVRESHQMSMTRDVADTVEALIHDVDSDAHRRSSE
jgi:predicted small metal-binding protein